MKLRFYLAAISTSLCSIVGVEAQPVFKPTPLAPATWSYTLQPSSGPALAGSVTIGPAGTVPAMTLGGGMAQVGGSPYPFVLATSSGSSDAVSEVIYQWAIASPTPLVFAGISPDVYFTGLRTVNSATGRLSFAAINVAALDYTGNGSQIYGDPPAQDTNADDYREEFAGCGGYGIDEHCGTSTFTIRGMYSIVDANTIGGYVQLRASTNGGLAFIDPVLSFSSTFRTNNPDAVLLLSPGIANASALVPEPAAWAMMIAGFGIVGVALRNNRRTTIRFA